MKRQWYLGRWRVGPGILEDTWFVNPYKISVIQIEPLERDGVWHIAEYQLKDELEIALSNVPKYVSEAALWENAEKIVNLLLSVLDGKFDQLDKQEQRDAIGALSIFFGKISKAVTLKRANYALVIDHRTKMSDLLASHVQLMLSEMYDMPRANISVSNSPKMGVWKILGDIFGINRRDMESEIRKLRIEGGIAKKKKWVKRKYDPDEETPDLHQKKIEKKLPPKKKKGGPGLGLGLGPSQE